MVHEEHLRESEIDNFLSSDDSDRQAITLCLTGIGNRKCSICAPKHIAVFGEFFNYFRDNLRERKVDERVINYYDHIFNGLRAVHCFYNPSIAELRRTRMPIK